MKEIIYAGGSFVTGDDIADALLEAAAALAESQLAESVQVPVLGPTGATEVASFLLGPASQIVAHHVEGDARELVELEAVTRLTDLARRHRPSAVPENAAPVGTDPDLEASAAAEVPEKSA